MGTKSELGGVSGCVCMCVCVCVSAQNYQTIQHCVAITDVVSVTFQVRSRVL